VDDDEIRALVTSLSRPHPSGGDVIERAAILATGSDSPAVVAWIVAHHGKPEAAAEPASAGLYGSHLAQGTRSGPRQPLRYVLPPGALA
jgi:hypothetical protein